MNDDINKEYDEIVDFTYTSKEPVALGAYMDVTDAAAQAGITWPVFVTQAAYEHCVAMPPDFRWQDLELRLWHMLWDLACEIRLQAPECDVLHYELFVPINPNAGRVPLKVVSCPENDGARFLIIMLTGEAVQEVQSKP